MSENSIEKVAMSMCARGRQFNVHVILNCLYYFTKPTFKIALLSSIPILLCDDVISVIIHDLIVFVHHDCYIVLRDLVRCK